MRDMKYFIHLFSSIFLPLAYSTIQSLSVLDRNLQTAYCSASPGFHYSSIRYIRHRKGPEKLISPVPCEVGYAGYYCTYKVSRLIFLYFKPARSTAGQRAITYYLLNHFEVKIRQFKAPFLQSTIGSTATVAVTHQFCYMSYLIKSAVYPVDFILLV